MSFKQNNFPCSREPAVCSPPSNSMYNLSIHFSVKWIDTTQWQKNRDNNIKWELCGNSPQSLYFWSKLEAGSCVSLCMWVLKAPPEWGTSELATMILSWKWKLFVRFTTSNFLRDQELGSAELINLLLLSIHVWRTLTSLSISALVIQCSG